MSMMFISALSLSLYGKYVTTRPRTPWHVGPLTSESSPLNGIVLVSINHQNLNIFGQMFVPRDLEWRHRDLKWRRTAEAPHCGVHKGQNF